MPDAVRFVLEKPSPAVRGGELVEDVGLVRNTGEFTPLEDSLLTRQIPTLLSHGSDFREIAGAIVGRAVWIPYFLTSRRAKATFVS
jgi:hypothetical protein